MRNADANHLLFVVNVPSFFVSHRLPVGVEARHRGWRVDLLSGRENPQAEQAATDTLARLGIGWKAAAFHAAGINPFAEMRGLLSVIAGVRAMKPDIVHTASPKGNLYGGIAARLCRVPKLVVAVSGQGFLFTGRQRGLKRWLATLYQRLIRWVYAHPDCTVIVQNRDDWQALMQAGLVDARQLRLIPGSGVDPALYAGSAPGLGEDIVLLPARLLTDKGVPEFVQAARSLRSQGCGWRFVLAGEADAANPAAIATEQVKAWVAEGVVEWWGHRTDMPAVFARAAIVCLPSHREGMPKALLEAAMAGKPVVTTDAVGCREAILPGESGLLVPVGDAEALAQAIRVLIEDAALRVRFGARGRALAVERFTQQAVIDGTFGIYEAGHGIDADG